MSTDADPKTPAAPPEPPFTRKPMAWGRPPATTFRAGPLPRPATWPNAPARPAGPAPTPAEPAAPSSNSAAAILGGSLIPQAAAPQAAPETGRLDLPEPQVSAAAVAPVQRPPVEPDLTVRPLPSAEVQGAVDRTSEVPAPAVETPAPIRPAPPIARSAPRRSGRLPLLIGLAVVVIALLTAGAWWLSRPQPIPGASVEAPVANPAGPVPMDAIPVGSATPEDAARPAPARPAAVPAPGGAPAQAAAPPSAPRPAATVPEPRPSATVAAPTPRAAPPAPEIETVPLITIAPAEPGPPPPTAAQPQTQNPDAPVVTQPQPLEAN